MRPFLITQNNPTVEPPIGNNLKTFYENSGILETNLTSAENTTKPTILKKTEYNAVGNNLKLAHFLKSENKNEVCTQKITTLNNVVLKPMFITNNQSSTVPKLDMSRKIVQLKDMPNVIRGQNGRILPKMKPKEKYVVKYLFTNMLFFLQHTQSTTRTLIPGTTSPFTEESYIIFKYIFSAN